MNLLQHIQELEQKLNTQTRELLNKDDQWRETLKNRRVDIHKEVQTKLKEALDKDLNHGNQYNTDANYAEFGVRFKNLSDAISNLAKD